MASYDLRSSTKSYYFFCPEKWEKLKIPRLSLISVKITEDVVRRTLCRTISVFDPYTRTYSEVSALHQNDFFNYYQANLIPLEKDQYQYCVDNGYDAARKYLKGLLPGSKKKSPERKETPRPAAVRPVAGTNASALPSSASTQLAVHGTSTFYTGAGAGGVSATSSTSHPRNVTPTGASAITSTKVTYPTVKPGSASASTAVTPRGSHSNVKPGGAVQVETVSEPTLFTSTDGQLNLGDEVLFEKHPAVVRWIGTRSRVGIQLFEEFPRQSYLAKVARFEYLEDTELLLVTQSQLKVPEEKSAVYLLVLGERVPTILSKSFGSLIVCHQPYIFDLELSTRLQLRFDAKIYTGLVEITQTQASALFQVKDPQRRVDTVQSGQLGLADAGGDHLVTVMNEENPQDYDYNAIGTMVRCENGFIQVQLDGEEKKVTIDKVFEIGVPPPWTEDRIADEKDFTNGDFVTTEMKGKYAYGVIKGVAVLPNYDKYAVVEALEGTANGSSPPRLIVPYLRNFLDDPKKAWVVPLRNVSKSGCFILCKQTRHSASSTDVEEGTLVAELKSKNVIDIETASKLSSTQCWKFDRLQINNRHLPYFLRIKKKKDRLLAYYMDQHKSISPKPRQGRFLWISADADPSAIDYEDIITSISYENGYVSFTNKEGNKKSSIDELFDLDDVPEWLKKTDVAPPGFVFQIGDVVQPDSSVPNIGIVKAFIKAPIGDDLCIVETLERRDSNVGEIPRQLLPYLKTWSVDPTRAECHKVKKLHGVQILVVLRPFSVGQFHNKAGSILVKLAEEKLLDYESKMVIKTFMMPLSPNVAEITIAQAFCLMRVKSLERRVWAYHCHQLDLVNKEPPVEVSVKLELNGPHYAQGIFVCVENGQIFAEIEGKTITTTIDNVNDPSAQPEWLFDGTNAQIGMYKADEVVEANGDILVYVKMAVRPPWCSEPAYLVEKLMRIDGKESSISEQYQPLIPLVRWFDLITEHTMILPENHLRLTVADRYLITVEERPGSWKKGALWRIDSGRIKSISSKNSGNTEIGFTGQSLGFVELLTKEKFSMMAATDDVDRRLRLVDDMGMADDTGDVEMLDASKGNDSIHYPDLTSMKLDSTSIRKPETMEVDSILKEPWEMMEKPVLREFQTVNSDDRREKRYFITVQESDGESASLGTLWVMDENESVTSHCGAKKSSEFIFKNAREVDPDTFQNLTEIHQKVERVYTLTELDAPVQTQPQEVPETPQVPVKEVADRRKLSRSSSSGETHHQSGGNSDASRFPTWLQNIDENWEKHKMQPESLVQVDSSDWRDCFAVLKAIIKNPTSYYPYAVVEPLAGDFSMVNEVRILPDDPIMSYLQQTHGGADKFKVVWLNKAKIPDFEFYLTRRAIHTSMEIILTGSILYAPYGKLYSDIENPKADLFFDNIDLSLEEYGFCIPSYQLAYLIRIQNRQSRVEVAFSGRLDIVDSRPGEIVVLQDSLTPKPCKIMRFESGLVRAEVGERISLYTLDSLFDLAHVPNWVTESAGLLASSDFRKDDRLVVQHSGEMFVRLKAVIQLPWEVEQWAVVELPSATSVALTPRSVVPYLTLLGVQEPSKAAVMPISKLQRPSEEKKQYFIRAEGSESKRGALWMKQGDKMTSWDTNHSVECGDRALSDHFVEIDFAVFQHLSRLDRTQRLRDFNSKREIAKKVGDASQPDKEVATASRSSQEAVAPSRQRSPDVSSSPVIAGNRKFAESDNPSYPKGKDVCYTDGTKELKGQVCWTGKCSGEYVVVLVPKGDDEAGTDGYFDGQKLVDCPPDKVAVLVPIDKLKKEKMNLGDYVELLEKPNPRGFVKSVSPKDGKTILGIELIRRYSKACNTSARFLCPKGFGIFVEESQVRRLDQPEEDILDVRERVQLIPTDSLKSILGTSKGIQGESNSCYLDSLIFSLFAFDDTLDEKIQVNRTEAWNEMLLDIFWSGIVNPLRKRKYVRCEKVAKLRQLMVDKSGDNAYLNETRDLPECIVLLFGEMLKIEKLLSIKCGNNVSETFCVETLTPDDSFKDVPILTSQFYLEYASMKMEFSITKPPEVLILQLPREKDFNRIVVPSLTIDLGSVPSKPDKRRCIKCRDPATHFSPLLLNQGGLTSTFLCQACAQLHRPLVQPLVTTAHSKRASGRLSLTAVICIERSHYNCFVRCGSDREAKWVFFDSMADQHKLDERLTNIPKVMEVDVSSWIRKILNAPPGTVLREAIKDEGDIKERLFKYPYALIYRPSS